MSFIESGTALHFTSFLCVLQKPRVQAVRTVLQQSCTDKPVEVLMYSPTAPHPCVATAAARADLPEHAVLSTSGGVAVDVDAGVDREAQ